ncbi:MAG TPA: tetratricopeptide repeat protein [Candidatus Dormibacteraeota bacterium]|nr:tetratricopeptide repeat protein [Candidatus Dormibacteraeota bacterium]
MKTRRSPASLLGLAMLLLTASIAIAQSEPEVRRARPVDEPPVPRALPADESIDRVLRSLKEESSEPPHHEGEGAAQRQLDYANGLFTRKLYDLAAPEYQKYLDDYPGRTGRANAYFSLGECYRNLGRASSARTNLQKVLNDYADSEFAGPAAYALAEMAFADKDYAAALPLFHRSVGKSKEPAVALSAHYFEARCLEALGRKEEAANIYAEVAEVGNPNPFREDARITAASIFTARGRKIDALKQYEALASEAQKPALKAESAVRGGMLALDLVQADKGKVDKAMADRAEALLRKGRALPEAGKFRAIAQAGLRRLQYQTGQYAQLLAEYKKEQGNLPEAAQAEVLLLAANSERQLGHSKEAETLYSQIIKKYADREEAKDAAYQRLINVYNSDPSALVSAADEFLATNPTSERANQAKLLKAEALYKQQNCAEAVPIYEELRASQLSAKLRTEAAYKLGLCHAQAKNIPGIIEAFTYYVQTFPDDPQVPAALAQRALAYEQDKNYAAAVADLNTILTKYPKTHEREAALQLKALILGQQENTKGMMETFRQLLREFPKSSVAAQAQYYIGKAAFESKDYKTALTALNAARQLNKDQYYNLASLRIMLCQFYLKDRTALTKEVNSFMANSPNTNVPPEVLEWLGIGYYNEKNFQAAEKYLSALRKIDNPGSVKPDFLFYLGDAATKLKNLPEAEDAFGKYLQTAKDPAGKAKVLLALGAVKISAHKPEEAQKIAEEIMTLQPEGRVNAEARLLAGEVQLERGNFDDAGKAFKGVALLYDDAAITPRALDKAALAYRQAGKTEEADRLSHELRERYPNYAGG